MLTGAGRSSSHRSPRPACDASTTRALTAYLRKDLALPKQRVNGLGHRRAA
ncbi:MULTISPECIES: hypothetical protein [unclassified Streptomyces]|uniref:hypothetical protein n=1 Tax=unclassified Streptomyces TaxID=2593676 RepID=UPI0037199E6C